MVADAPAVAPEGRPAAAVTPSARGGRRQVTAIRLKPGRNKRRATTWAAVGARRAHQRPPLACAEHAAGRSLQEIARRIRRPALEQPIEARESPQRP